MIKAVIFDIDGVLMDSFEANYEFMTDIASRLNLKFISKREYKLNFAKPFREILKSANSLSDVGEVEKLIEKIRKKVSYPFRLVKTYDQCEESLNSLNKKYKLALVTSRPVSGLKVYYKHAKNEKLFKTAITLNDVKNHKPHPESLLLAAKKLKIKPEEAIYVGDAKSDMLAAKAAGMKSIIFNKIPVRGATANIKHFKQLVPTINKIASNV
ncbi:MAG: HAD-IA family hydrolase [Candidatus Doudnabacteria bacterium]|nr:HAD-IA family hydrolase [Candidatus Doudnabacteria bacterium]